MHQILYRNSSRLARATNTLHMRFSPVHDSCSDRVENGSGTRSRSWVVLLIKVALDVVGRRPRGEDRDGDWNGTAGCKCPPATLADGVRADAKPSTHFNVGTSRAAEVTARQYESGRKSARQQLTDSAFVPSREAIAYSHATDGHASRDERTSDQARHAPSAGVREDTAEHRDTGHLMLAS